MLRNVCVCVLCVLTFSSLLEAQTREEKVRRDREKVEASGYWIYNDLERGFEKARQTKQPMLVVLRCIPCEECVKLDEELMEKDPQLKPLMDQFVRVRQISTNGLDLSLFQYDYDQSFAVFLLNTDRTIYGRFGTRSHHTLWSEDVSIAGLAKAMQGALDLHAKYDQVKDSLAAKQGPQPDVPSPEHYPLLEGRYRSQINEKKEVVKSCIHCHQVGDAQRDFYLSQNKTLPERILFQYPHPKILGLILDPTEKATVKEVKPDSIAAKAGFQRGDELLTLAGQPLLSIADIQWVLHRAESQDQLTAQIDRNGKKQQLTLTLPTGWKRADDLSWRVSSWPMRRMVLGGAVLEETTPEERTAAGLPAKAPMALRIRGLGKYGLHATARKRGFQVGDIITGFDGQTNLARETDLLAYGINAHQPGETVSVTVFRGGKQLELSLPRQK
ncbi:Trx7/PDZ domain-containing (seleno)protein [Gimesia panareensis]|uniref:Trx7/PDZ domain-containing (seleno)protein n=1 Tax=Gimesia panareensis TaxID=2527978 RepID=UPI001189B0F9|nr:Trx7/PDZ domain-containing (seleno)protein [Gimesia panareensis]QDU52822.1 putative periplasmic serine endoprotease DegP-like precursor [Gimesia panareensis]